MSLAAPAIQHTGGPPDDGKKRSLPAWPVTAVLACYPLWWALGLGVLIFAGLTAYDTQRIKNTYLELAGSDSEFLGKTAIMGALTLYLDFLNLFLFLLSFMGQRE